MRTYQATGVTTIRLGLIQATQQRTLGSFVLTQAVQTSTLKARSFGYCT